MARVTEDASKKETVIITNEPKFWAIVSALIIASISIVFVSSKSKMRNSPGLKKFVMFVLLVLIFTLIPLGLSFMRKEIECTGCMTSGLFIKCKPGTGKGGKECDDYERFKERMKSYIEELREVSGILMGMADKVSDSYEAVIAQVEEVKKRISRLQTPNIESISIAGINPFDCKIPIIGTNVCTALSSSINAGIVKPLNESLSRVAGELSGVAGQVIKVTTKPIQEIMSEVAKIGEELSTLVDNLEVDINRISSIYDGIRDIISKANVPNLLLGYITEMMNDFFQGDTAFYVYVFLSLVLLAIFGLVSSIIGTFLGFVFKV